MPTALESRSPDFEPETAPFATRVRVAVDEKIVWFAIQVLPARLLAWLIHQRCLWRRARRRQHAS